LLDIRLGALLLLEVLRHADRFQFAGQGIIYDIWGAAIQPPEDERNRIKKPLLCINSEAFMYSPTHFEAVLTLGKEARANGALSWLMTVRGTVHMLCLTSRSFAPESSLCFVRQPPILSAPTPRQRLPRILKTCHA